MVRRVQTKPLHLAVLAADNEAVKNALRSSSCVNDLDSAGRSAVMCALAGENWQQLDSSPSDASFRQLEVFRTLVNDSQVSLHTLNASQRPYRGVTPLGMAAWLDRSDIIRVLLEESVVGVVVDGTDAHGATPLMYAARDGRLDVVKLLLRHGARPDLRDANNRTAIQFALPFPQVLWLCESALRRHRLLDNSSGSDTTLFQSCLPQTNIFVPPAASAFTVKRTNTLIVAINICDVEQIHSILFPFTGIFQQPTLVNLPDALGWSPLHYAVSTPTPSPEILDVLATAGAVGPLFTAQEEWTPLHCFAIASRDRRPTQQQVDVWRSALSRFIGPSAKLEIPLDAKDIDEETCLHLAAERGACVELLILFLESDQDGRVREMRNARGLTPLEVCRPEFRAAFGRDLDDVRSSSALSCRTVRGSAYSGSMASLGSFHPPNTVPEESELNDSASVLDNVDISVSAEQLLANLRLTSPEESHAATPFHLNVLSNLVGEAEALSSVIVAHYRTAAVEAGRDVRGLREAAGRAQMRVERIGREVEAKMRERGVVGAVRRRFDRGSEDSGVTAVSIETPAEPDRSVEVLGSTDCERAIPIVVVESPGLSTKPDAIEITPKRLTGTMKLRAWMKRKLQVTEIAQPSKLAAIPEQQEVSVALAVPSSPPPSPTTHQENLSVDAWVDGMLTSSHSTLEAASRDLERIRESIASAEHFISIVDRSAARVERVVARALQKRETVISKLRATSLTSSSDNDEFFVRPGLLSPKSSVASLASVYSARSSCLSLAATLSEQEDDDTRVVRRLLLRKIETGANGARDELEKGVNWLRTIKEVVQSAKKTAYV
ncbi:hypothetical protein MIND_00219500 [Mycena indigotica]|uniref:Ankyrin n=1 Tax=Mycena indigotica TaxID=2126181 RepID=A0A8H6T5C5_9AGAR|nr:uncharacterized protein MIND_00219500 [Mycena indigotica]KAF7312073.1 hypothetical protein MIND_00219500 [Mycena indigotica]